MSCLLCNDCCIRLMRLCGDVQEVVSTKAYKIVIQFHTDVSVNEKGFIANITWQECKYISNTCAQCFIDISVLSIEECTLANGGCQHICIPASESNSSTRICKCNPGFELSVDDRASCKGSLICVV